MTVRTLPPAHRSFVVLLLTSSLMGAGLDGVVSSSTYLFSRRNVDDDELTHLRMHESFRLRYRPPFQENFQFNTSGVVYFDPLNPAVGGDPALNLYAANADFRRLFSLFDVTAGRFFVYDPSNSGRIDGLKVTGSLPLKMRVSLYGGGFVRAGGRVSNPVNDHLLGVHVSVPVRSRTTVAIALSQKALEREAYKRGSGTIEVPNISERRLGLRVNTIFRSWTLFLKLVEDLQSRHVQETNVAIRTSRGPFQRLSLEYFFRRPRIPHNSIFSVFDARPNQEIALSTVFKPKSSWQLFSQIRTVLLADTSTFALNIGVGMSTLSATYQFQEGYGGKFHRIGVDGRYRLFPRLLVRGTANWGKYRPLHASWENLGAVTVGLSYQATKLFAMRTDVHLLRNRNFTRDNRLLVSLNYVLP
ncbi:MAG: hypothetical protein ACE5GH_06295 [Fidelibacterota bacterium]